jgi:tetratricopeptide (TPR) repeat protein
VFRHLSCCLACFDATLLAKEAIEQPFSAEEEARIDRTLAGKAREQRQRELAELAGKTEDRAEQRGKVIEVPPPVFRRTWSRLVAVAAVVPVVVFSIAAYRGAILPGKYINESSHEIADASRGRNAGWQIDMKPFEQVVKNGKARNNTMIKARKWLPNLKWAAEHAWKDSDEARAYYLWGATLNILETEPELALHCLRKAVELQIDEPEYRNGLGVALWNSGNVAEGIEHLQRACDLAGDDPQIDDSIKNTWAFNLATAKEQQQELIDQGQD